MNEQVEKVWLAAVVERQMKRIKELEADLMRLNELNDYHTYYPNKEKEFMSILSKYRNEVE